MIPGVITPPEYIRTNTVHMYAHWWERFPHTARGAMAAAVRSAFSCCRSSPLGVCVFVRDFRSSHAVSLGSRPPSPGLAADRWCWTLGLVDALPLGSNNAASQCSG